jgi:hypothetical protein
MSERAGRNAGASRRPAVGGQARARPSIVGRWWLVGRPVGLSVLIGVMVAESIGFFAAALEALRSWSEDWPAALVAVANGALLLRKARSLWRYHRTAWLAVVGLSALGALVEAVQIARGHGGPGAWSSLGWAVVTVAYLGHPRIRALFLHPRGHEPPADEPPS